METKQTEDKESMIQRTRKSFDSRMEDIKILNELDRLENESNDYLNIVEKLKNELGNKEDYGLSIDYVEEGTFNDQREPYIRFQLSWGGPSEEFRIYATNEIEFWFLDWFTGEHINLGTIEADEIFNFLGGSDFEELKSLYHKEQ